MSQDPKSPSSAKAGTSNLPKTLEDLNKTGDKKLGQILVEYNFITTEQLAEAMAEQAQVNAQGGKKFKLGEILLFKNLVTIQQLHTALRQQTKKAELSRISSVQAKQRSDDSRINRMSRKPTPPPEPTGFQKFLNFFKKS